MANVINDVEPLYIFLRFADQDKIPNLGEVLMEYQNMRHTYSSKFTHDPSHFRQIMQVIDSRMTTVMSGTYVQTACALNPYVDYTMGTTQRVLRELRMGLDKMLDAEGAAVALQEFELFRRKLGEFSTDTARCMAIDRKTSAAAWWATFGEDAPMLSQVARRLLSQCVSSSGCERNWSTFAYIHTKLRNRLSHKKLDKLVFVNYNLRLRLERASKVADSYDYDPISSFMDLSLYRQQSSIEQWMNQSRSNGDPSFDEDSEFSDTPVPSQQFTNIGRQHGDNEDVEVWAETTVGDTHLGKRKTKISPLQRQGKRTRTDDEEVIGSDESTPDPSGDDNDPSGDDNDHGGSDGNDGAASGLQHGGAIVFTGEEDYTHATQDTDHGAPVSQRQTRSAHTRGRQALLTYDQDSSSSSSTGQYQGPGQYYNPYSTSPPTGGFLWPPPGTMNPSVPRSVAALPYLQLHGYTPYGVPYGQGYGQPTYPYLPETSEPYEGPPGERFND